jgi:hypothetical protein
MAALNIQADQMEFRIVPRKPPDRYSVGSEA